MQPALASQQGLLSNERVRRTPRSLFPVRLQRASISPRRTLLVTKAVKTLETSKECRGDPFHPLRPQHELAINECLERGLSLRCVDPLQLVVLRRQLYSI